MAKLSKIGLNIVLLLLFQGAHAQIKYWVEFTDKGPQSNPDQAWVSEKTYQQRATLGLPIRQASDIPVYTPYLHMLQQAGFEPVALSKWLNATSMFLAPSEVEQVASFPFVQAVIPFRGEVFLTSTDRPAISDSTQLHPALLQMQAKAFLERGITGQGVDVGIIDAGFVGANNNPALKPLIERNAVVAWKDLVNPEKASPYEEMETFLDWHGTKVWQGVGGYIPSRDQYMGIAVDANYYLVRSEHGTKEYRGEQDLWIAGMEWLDSLGVRITNCSLGYSRGFDDPEENYSPDEMDGSTKISQAVQTAVEEKGMILIISAGNDGNDISWRYISTPAEAKGVISVGATNYPVWDKAGYSGVGPDYLPYLKPDVSVYAPDGTSFAAPVITGLVAGMLQLDSTLQPARVQELLQASGHLDVPNNYLGYGVPNCEYLYQALTGGEIPVKYVCHELAPTKPISTTFTPADYHWQAGEALVAFHLGEDGRTVIQERKIILTEEDDEVKIVPPGAKVFLTNIVSSTGACVNIPWKNQPEEKTE